MKYIVRSFWALLVSAFAVVVFIIPQAILTCLQMFTPRRANALYALYRIFRFWLWSVVLFVLHGASYEKHLNEKLGIDLKESVDYNF